MRSKFAVSLVASFLTVLVLLVGFRFSADDEVKSSPKAAREKLTKNERMITTHAQRMIDEGRRIFRLATFGGRRFWRDAFQLHKTTAAEKNAGVGSAEGPKTAPLAGLKANVNALPKNLQGQLKAGKIGLNDAATNRRRR